MMNRATTEWFYRPIVAAMNAADEAGGPKGAQYVALMDAVIAEAQRRAEPKRRGEKKKKPDVALEIAKMLDGTEWSVETLDEIAEVLRSACYQVRDVDDIDNGEAESDDANREMGLPEEEDWGHK